MRSLTTQSGKPPPVAASWYCCAEAVCAPLQRRARHRTGLAAYNILEGFEGDPDADARRGRKGGWRFHGLPWRQN
jgi:sulfur dioxygenase